MYAHSVTTGLTPFLATYIDIINSFIIFINYLITTDKVVSNNKVHNFLPHNYVLLTMIIIERMKLLLMQYSPLIIILPRPCEQRKLGSEEWEIEIICRKECNSTHHY